MPWWAWLAVGAVLLGTEIAIQTDFWLAVLGFAAIGVGIIGFAGLTGPIWVQWVIFAVLSVFFAVFVRRQLHERFVGTAPGIKPELIGESATVQEEIAPGAVGPVELRGSIWQARNVGDAPLSAKARARVERVDGLLLEVRG